MFEVLVEESFMESFKSGVASSEHPFLARLIVVECHVEEHRVIHIIVPFDCDANVMSLRLTVDEEKFLVSFVISLTF